MCVLPEIDEIKRKLGIEDDELALRTQAIIRKLQVDQDHIADLHDFVYYTCKIENDPKKKEAISLPELLLFILYKAREINDEPRLDAKWRPIKVVDNVTRDMQEKGYKTPATESRHYKYGVYSQLILGDLAKLEQEGFITCERNPAIYKLTPRATKRINDWLIPRLEAWPEFLKLLNERVRYWIVAAIVAPGKVKRLSKIRPMLETGQIRLDPAKEGELKSIRTTIDSRVGPVLRKLENEERPPIDSLDDVQDEALTQPELVKRTLDEMLRKAYPPLPVSQFPGLAVQTYNEFFPSSDGKPTNYHILIQTENVEHFRFLLSVAGEFKCEKVVMGPKEYSVLRRFGWASTGISPFLCREGKLEPMGESKEIRSQDQVLIFSFTDEEDVDATIHTVKTTGARIILTFAVCKSWEKIQRWRNESLFVKTKVAPHSIAYSLCGQIPSVGIDADLVQVLTRRDRIDLAKSIGQCLKRSEFGYFISPRGTTSKLFLYEKQLRSDMLQYYERLVRIACEEIGEIAPEVLITSKDVDLAGSIGEFLTIPTAKIMLTSSGSYVEFQGTVYSLKDFSNAIKGKKIAYIGFSDSELTEHILEIIGFLKAASADFETYVLFDMLELPWDDRQFFSLRSALGLSEVWLVPEFKGLVEDELALRKELGLFSAEEYARFGRVPSVHDFPPLNGFSKNDVTGEIYGK